LLFDLESYFSILYRGISTGQPCVRNIDSTTCTKCSEGESSFQTGGGEGRCHNARSKRLKS